MDEREPNTAVQPNVMLVPDSRDAERAYLPGDLVAQVYGKWWTTPDTIRESLTPRQRVEYEQYLVCVLCKRPCAGTCTRGRSRR